MRKFLIYFFALVLGVVSLSSCNKDDEETTGPGSSTEEYTDPASLDKQVRTIRTASAGKGVNIILMGDGFTVQDIQDGTYDRVMNVSAEALFSVQPMKALSNYFNVFAVTAVSTDRIFDGGTALGCLVGKDGITGKGEFDESMHTKARLYAKSVPGIDVDESIIAVVINTETYGGTTFYGESYDDDQAYAYTTLAGGLESTIFRQTLLHETIGHGLAKLGDEYVTYYEKIGTYDAYGVNYAHDRGWYQNISLTDDPEQTPWAQFQNDSRYASENLGVYEGAYTYATGVYRPTLNSIMRDTNTEGMTFNAPSRQAIYNWTMKLGTGNWPEYEEFVAFDQANR